MNTFRAYLISTEDRFSKSTGKSILGSLVILCFGLAACDQAPLGEAPQQDIRQPMFSMPSQQSPTALQKDNGYRIVWDKFDSGFKVGFDPDDKWFYFGADFYVGDDGVETTSSSGLKVVSSGTNAVTGAPAFVRTLGQEGTAGNPFLPGGLDHVKWLVYMSHFSSSGFPGFDAIEGQELKCEGTLSGQSYGNEAHPFASVGNPQDDLRLGAVAMNSIDFESFMVFDFFLSNERLYAFYERLPFGRGTNGNSANYAAFSFAIPISDRNPEDEHNLKIGYDKTKGVVRWLVDDREVFRVDRIGHLIDRKYMVIDHGGTEEDVSPNQINCGMGMFTLLDAHGPSSTGLVKLSNAPGFYFNPEVGEPTSEVFEDDASLASNRLFGQGAELRMRQYVVSSRKVE